MSETICATGDSSETARSRAYQDWRYVLAAIIAGLSLLMLAFLQAGAWRDRAQFQRRLNAAGSPSGHLGETLVNGLALLNASLFRFQLSGRELEREGFLEKSRRIATLLSEQKPFLASQEERELAEQIETAFRRYLSETDEFVPVRGIRRGTAETLASTLETTLAPAADPASRLADFQKARRAELREESARALQSLRVNMEFSIATCGALLASILVLMHGAVVAPRKRRLDEIQMARDSQTKLTTLGELATGVAHEIRNPLTAIKFRLFSLKKVFGASLSDSEDFQTIRSEIDRLERIVKSVLQFARPPDPQLNSVSSAELLDHVYHLLEPEVSRRNSRIILDSGEPVSFRADRQQLEQVLINLSQNAAESISSGGTITLRARRGAARLTNQPEPVVLLEVIDTGPGIPLEIQKRLFDPFFSTKEGGTGLGLAIAARIVERHGGRMHFSTTKDQGTTFTVVLPIENNHVQNANPPDRR